MQHYERLPGETVRMCGLLCPFVQFIAPRLSMTIGFFSIHLRVRSFGTGMNTSAFRSGHHTTIFFEGYGDLKHPGNECESIQLSRTRQKKPVCVCVRVNNSKERLQCWQPKKQIPGNTDICCLCIHGRCAWVCMCVFLPARHDGSVCVSGSSMWLKKN